MKEVKSPKKPLLYYYGIVLLIIIVFNVLVTPMLTKTMVKEVDYGTFMSKIKRLMMSRLRIIRSFLQIKMIKIPSIKQV